MDKNRERFARIMAETNGKTTDRLMALVENRGGKILRELGVISAVAAEIPGEELERFSRSNLVRKVWGDLRAEVRLNIAAAAVGGRTAQRAGYKGSGVVIGIIDTGIYPHVDLVEPENRILAWLDLVNGRHLPYDDHGHGTHVAGIIAGNGGAAEGKYAGMAPEASLVGIKALDKEGFGFLSDIIAALEWCIKNSGALKMKALNLSLGAPTQESWRTDPLGRAAAAAWKAGITVCAAGNQGGKEASVETPGINPVIITVGNSDDRIPSPENGRSSNRFSGIGSNGGPPSKPDLTAPGTGIMSLANQGADYRAFTGTSMAAGIVTGAVAVIYQKWPGIKPDQVKRILLKTAKSMELGPKLHDSGTLDLERIFDARPVMTATRREELLKTVGVHLLKTLADGTGSQKAGFNNKIRAALGGALKEAVNEAVQKKN